MIRVDWIVGLPTTLGGFDMIQNHVHAAPTRATATAAYAVDITRDMCLRSGAGTCLNFLISDTEMADMANYVADDKLINAYAVFTSMKNLRTSCFILQ